MLILAQYLKLLCVKNVLKLLQYAVRVYCILYTVYFMKAVSWNLLRDSEREKSSTIKKKIKIKLLARNKYIDRQVPFNNIFIKLLL
jgi:hypothetical protein